MKKISWGFVSFMGILLIFSIPHSILIASQRMMRSQRGIQWQDRISATLTVASTSLMSLAITEDQPVDIINKSTFISLSRGLDFAVAGE